MQCLRLQNLNFEEYRQIRLGWPEQAIIPRTQDELSWNPNHKESCRELDLSQIIIIIIIIIVIIIIIIIIIIAIELSLGDSSPNTSTDKTIKNKCTQKKQYKNTVQTIQNKVNASTHSTTTSTQLSKHPHIHSPALDKEWKNTLLEIYWFRK